MQHLLYIAVLLVYGIVTVAHLVPASMPTWLTGRVRLLGWLGVTLHVATLVGDAVLGEWTPGLPEALSGMSVGIMIAYAAVAKGRQRAIGILLVPLALVSLGTALVVPHQQVSALAESTATNAWLPIHLTLLFAGVGGFALSGAVGATYLYVHKALKAKRFEVISRFPSLDALDQIQFRAMFFGFVALTLGIGAGGALAAASFQQNWAMDPKVLYTLFVWAVYFAALQSRLVLGRRGRFTAWFSISGFGLMVFSLLGLNFFLSSSWHAYVG